MHAQESRRLQPRDDTQKLIDSFLSHPDSHSLNPPKDLNYVDLRSFLETARLNRLPWQQPGENTENAVLIDDRYHTSTRAPSGRLESNEEAGEVVRHKEISVKEFYDTAKDEQVPIIKAFYLYSLIEPAETCHQS
jgi:hypothetical protein